MKKLLVLVLMTLALSACATGYDDDPPMEPERDRRPPRDFGGGERGERGSRRAAIANDFALPPAWWHEPATAEPLNLTADQFARLDALTPQQDEIDRLEHDAMTAMRDVRAAIETKGTTADDIVGAGKRLRELRDTLLERQIKLLASQREILTQEQWEQLQEQLANQWRGRRIDNTRGPGMGGRGGRGGRGGFGGRRPGGVW